jgi:signal peptidase I
LSGNLEIAGSNGRLNGPSLMKRRSKIALALMVPVVLAATAVIIYSIFFLHFVSVPTGAMQNTILPGDRVVTTRLVGEIKRGDVIIFKYPLDTSTQYIKRVIGLPGESIELRGSKVYIDGNELPEHRFLVEPPPRLPDGKPLKEISSEGEGPYNVFYTRKDTEGETEPDLSMQYGSGSAYRIPERHYFVMGDNRDNSEDSRYWGTVARDLITGKALAIYFSVEHNIFAEGRDSDTIRWRRMFTRVK